MYIIECIFITLCSFIQETFLRFKLYLNEREIAGNITSMFLHSHFLLATTMDHRLNVFSWLTSNKHLLPLYMRNLFPMYRRNFGLLRLTVF